MARPTGQTLKLQVSRLNTPVDRGLIHFKQLTILELFVFLGNNECCISLICSNNTAVIWNQKACRAIILARFVAFICRMRSVCLHTLHISVFNRSQSSVCTGLSAWCPVMTLFKLSQLPPNMDDSVSQCSRQGPSNQSCHEQCLSHANNCASRVE